MPTLLLPVLLVLTLLYPAVPRTAVPTGGPEGVWLINSNVAVQIFDCGVQLCGLAAQAA